MRIPTLWATVTNSERMSKCFGLRKTFSLYGGIPKEWESIGNTVLRGETLNFWIPRRCTKILEWSPWGAPRKELSKMILHAKFWDLEQKLRMFYKTLCEVVKLHKNQSWTFDYRLRTFTPVSNTQIWVFWAKMVFWTRVPLYASPTPRTTQQRLERERKKLKGIWDFERRLREWSVLGTWGLREKLQGFGRCGLSRD
jgi:hypothetical protein